MNTHKHRNPPTHTPTHTHTQHTQLKRLNQHTHTHTHTQLKRLKAPSAKMGEAARQARRMGQPVTILAQHLVNMEHGLLSQEQLV
jgi:hypothetical protein